MSRGESVFIFNSATLPPAQAKCALLPMHNEWVVLHSSRPWWRGVCKEIRSEFGHRLGALRTHTHTHPVCTETHTNRHAEVYLTSLSLTPCLGFSVVYRLSVSLSVSLSLSISLPLFLSRLLTLHLSLSNKLSFNLSFVVIPSL